MSRVDLAAASGLHRNYLMSVERGDRNISMANLLRIAAALGTTVPELLSKVIDEPWTETGRRRNADREDQ